MNFARPLSYFVFAFCSTVAASFAPGALADFGRSLAAVDSPHGISPDRGSFQIATSARSLSQKDLIFYNILSTEGKDLAWPTFPRTWHEQSVSEYISSNTALGFNAGLVSGNVSIDYKYSMKSSLVIVASNRRADATLDKNGVTVAPVDQPLEFEIFHWDPVSRRTLPNVRQGYPMVAFCAFESSISVGFGTKGGLTFMGSGQSLESGQSHNITHTLFSRFFQVNGDLSPNEMLKLVCAGKFRQQVQEYVQRDFSRAVVEMNANLNPANECQPDPKNDGPDGDAGCREWHKKYERPIQKITTPRCVFQHQGLYMCQLTSKENGNCSMYWDKSRDKAIDADQKIQGKYYSRATDKPYEFNCDSAAGLKCAMIKNPWVAFGVPVWQGAARCVRK